MNEARRAYDLIRGYVNREWDRIQGLERLQAWRELEESRNPGSVVAEPVDLPPADTPAAARQVLGISATAKFEEIRKAFETLNKKSDPTQFPAGSQEEKHAAEIQKRIHWAYRVLTDGTDETEKRFRSLEID